jgi:glycosyltransferase involved in cell wall biosynthesis
MIGQTSVVIACYNGEIFLPEALESVCQQTRAVREIIVVDDGSDNPIRPPSEWKGPPLRIIRTENRGPAAARNFGVSLSSGDFIAFLDSDDAWDPTKIEMQEKVLGASRDNVAVFTQRVEKPGWLPCAPAVYPPDDVSDDEFWVRLWTTTFIATPSLMTRRDVFLRIGGFNECLRYCEDRELWFRLLKAGRFIQIPLPLTYRRMHAGQMTENFDQIAVYLRKCRLLVMLQHGERLAAAGISPRQQHEDARKEYSNNLQILYFKRQFSAVRWLLWHYLWQYPSDLRMLKYALLSLFPARFFTAIRDKVNNKRKLDAIPGARKG